MDEYTIFCTAEQTRKAFGLGASIEFIKIGEGKPLHYICSRENKGYYKIPTAEQMIGFLRSKGMKFYFNDLTTFWQVVYDINITGQGCSDNKELKAIDVALEYLENLKQ